ncbi:glycosyltransferase [Paenibacillus sp. 1P07SE]|uniref:glycosyltransferase n=1 Tax=Paenibacillus sp. 1P07SE TaxID=3132209 RepID=UPI0039A5756F
MISKKPHYVFMLGDYYPNYSANGLCAKKIIEVLKSKTDITVICYKSIVNLPTEEIVDSQRIIRIETTEHKIRNRINHVLSDEESGKLKKKIHLALLRVIQLTRYANSIFSKRNIKKTYHQEFLEALNKIKDPIDVIIPFCFPFEAIYAALAYKQKYNRAVSVIPYLFDKFSVSETLHRTSWNKRLKLKSHLNLEKRVLIESNKVFATFDWKNHLSENFPDHMGGITFTNIPALTEIKSGKVVNYDNDKVNIVYAGALNRKNRSPLYTLKIIERITSTNKSIVFHIYSKGDCDEIIRKYVDNNPVNIYNHGSVNTDSAYAALKASDFLMSIGNFDITQTPSKIYEYMALGKPIIHMYHKDQDPIIDLLELYPKSICIKQQKDIKEEDVSKLIEFIIGNKDCTDIQFKEIKKLFINATPEWTADLIINSTKKRGELA